jgi:alpha-tubulin suppressor-like RCC1 family protein
MSVSGVTGAIAISAGSGHTCALLAGGSAECWGNDASGQLGDGAPAGMQSKPSKPVAVPGISGVIAISAGESHTGAILSDGSVECWGLNLSGQLGDGGPTGMAFTPSKPAAGGALASGGHAPHGPHGVLLHFADLSFGGRPTRRVSR